MKIETIHRKVEKDYSDRVVNDIWVRQENKESKPTNDNSIQDFITNSIQQNREQIICLYIPTIKQEIRKLIENIGKNNRIYIYTKEQENLEELSKFCLIRTHANIAGSFILIKHDSIINGFFNTKNLFNKESNQLSLELDTKQCGEFWHYFITCFWHYVDKEYINGARKEVRDNNQEDFLPPHNNDFDKNIMLESVKSDKKNSLLFICKNSPIRQHTYHFNKCVFMLQDFNVLDDEILQYDKESRFSISNIGFDCIDNKIFMSDNQSLLYSITLNEKQEEQLNKLKDSLKDSAYFKHSIALKDIVNKEILYLNGKEAIIEEEYKHIDNIQCDKFIDKEEFEALELDYENIWQEQYPHTCNITFTYDIIPYFTPESYKEAILYKEWSDTHTALHQIIDKELKNIESIQNKQKELDGLKALVGNVLKSFKQFFLGKDTNLNHIKDDIETLKEKADIHSLNIEYMQDYIEVLQQYAKVINENGGEIEIKLDEAKEHNKWQQRKNKLEEDIINKEKKCKEYKEALDKKEQDYKEKENKIQEIQEKKDSLIKQEENMKENLKTLKEQEKALQKQENDIAQEIKRNEEKQQQKEKELASKTTNKE